jgi:hypothetical protein
VKIPWRLVLRVLLIVVIVGLGWVRYSSTHRPKAAPAVPAITDLAATSPLNQPGGGPAPAEGYQVYSALYHAPANEPLAFAENSATDIPQVGGSCLKPSTPEQQQMADALVANNRLSHTWEQKFSIPAGYRLLSHAEVPQALACLQTHGRDAEKCAAFAGLKHVRLLGVPGFDKAQDKALVSVIKNCGGVCGSGGIFAVEKKGDTWQRTETTDFTRDCSWMY